MKVPVSIGEICENCQTIKRKGVLRVLCTNPRHKQRQRNRKGRRTRTGRY